MVPQGLNPQPHKMFITVAEYKTNQKNSKKGSGGGGGGGGKRNSGILNYVKPSKSVYLNVRLTRGLNPSPHKMFVMVAE